MHENNQTYLEYYISHLKPAISSLDVAIKCNSRLNNKEIAGILGISEEEIKQIRERHSLKAINQNTLLKIMEEGSSNICKIFKRELETGSPFTYTREQFAYIYGFDTTIINDVCDRLNIYELTWQNMPVVFGHLPSMD